MRPYCEVMPGSCSTGRCFIHGSRRRGNPLRKSICTSGSLYTPLVSYTYTGALSVCRRVPPSIVTVGVRCTRRIATLNSGYNVPGMYTFSEPGYVILICLSIMINRL